MSEAGALVLITTSFPIDGDGSEAAGSFVSDLAAELALHVPIRVVAPGRAFTRQKRADGVETFCYPAPIQPLSTLRLWVPSELDAVCRVLAAGENATRQAIQAGPATQMLALWALPPGHWARRVSLESGVPYAVWTLGSDIWTLGRIPVVRSYLRSVLRQARVCYSDGVQLAEETRSICGREVEFLPSTRRITRRRAAPLKHEPPYRLLFLGRWHRNKGVDLLVEALEHLGDDDWSRIEAVDICGGGPLEPRVRFGVDALCAKGRPVKLQGYLSKPAAEEAISSADYLLIPSRVESIPVVFSDAVKLGCPVLATPVGDLRALLSQPPRCGLVADAVSAKAFAMLISQALRESAASFAPGLEICAKKFGIEASAFRILSGR